MYLFSVPNRTDFEKEKGGTQIVGRIILKMINQASQLGPMTKNHKRTVSKTIVLSF